MCGSNGAATTKAAVEAGYRAIWGSPNSWYLSCYSDKCGQSGGGAGFEPWQHVYAQEPFLCRSASAAGCGTNGPDVAITDLHLAVGSHRLSADDVRRTRWSGLRTFGTCSFTEPLAALLDLAQEHR